MAWAGPSSDKPVWCTSTVKGGATAQNVSCTTADPAAGGPEVALLEGKGAPGQVMAQTVSDTPAYPLGATLQSATYEKFTSQIDLGKYLVKQYHIRTPDELSSCETCHR
jgi:hypothetical protein